MSSQQQAEKSLPTVADIMRDLRERMDEIEKPTGSRLWPKLSVEQEQIGRITYLLLQWTRYLQDFGYDDPDKTEPYHTGYLVGEDLWAG